MAIAAACHMRPVFCNTLRPLRAKRPRPGHGIQRTYLRQAGSSARLLLRQYRGLFVPGTSNPLPLSCTSKELTPATANKMNAGTAILREPKPTGRLPETRSTRQSWADFGSTRTTKVNVEDMQD